MNQTLPDDVSLFIGQYVLTVSHLELLLFLFDGREQTWTIRRLAQEMRTHEALVRHQLVALMGPIQRRTEPSEMFQFASNEDFPVRETVRRLSELYRSHRHTVVAEIYTRRSQKIQNLADTLKVKK